MTLEQYLLEIEKFVKDYLENSHMKKYVLGLSGGVDSTLVAAIVRKSLGKDKLLCVNIPIESHPSDNKDAYQVAKELDLEIVTFDGTEMFLAALKEYQKLGIELDRGTRSNLKCRIRMSILYAFAQKENGLVIGTDNADEKYTGYFTKYGDGGVDLLPIAYLLKGEVHKACQLYGVSDYLALRTPSAGLFEGQTDEKEMGVTYEDLDNYLLGKEVAEDVKKRIEHLHKISAHKRDPIPTPIAFKRDV